MVCEMDGNLDNDAVSSRLGEVFSRQWRDFDSTDLVEQSRGRRSSKRNFIRLVDLAFR